MNVTPAQNIQRSTPTAQSVPSIFSVGVAVNSTCKFSCSKLFWDYLWEYSDNDLGFKLCRSLEQVIRDVTEVPTTQINPVSSSFKELWCLAGGRCSWTRPAASTVPAAQPCTLQATLARSTSRIRGMEAGRGFRILHGSKVCLFVCQWRWVLRRRARLR